MAFLSISPQNRGQAKKMRGHLIAASLLYLCVSFSQACDRTIHENVDFPGSDIKFLYSPDTNHCQKLCTQHPACLFFTFVRPDWTQDQSRHFYCYLKTTPSGMPLVRKPLLGVSSGFSLKPCSPDPNPCLPEVYYNTDFPGADYRTLFTHDYEECQRACTRDPSCQFFSYVIEGHEDPSIRYKCFLKFSWNVPRTPRIMRLVGVISGFALRPSEARPFDIACPAKLFMNTLMEGEDSEQHLSSSPQDCQTLCSAHPKCNYFSYLSETFSCHLKTNPDQFLAKAQTGVTSGLPARYCLLDSSWRNQSLEGIDFLGSDIFHEPKDSVEECEKACTRNYNCQFYTYVTEEFADKTFWRRCFHKRVITMPAPPKVTKEVNLVSGFPQRDCV